MNAVEAIIEIGDPRQGHSDLPHTMCVARAPVHSGAIGCGLRISKRRPIANSLAVRPISDSQWCGRKIAFTACRAKQPQSLLLTYPSPGRRISEFISQYLGRNESHPPRLGTTLWAQCPPCSFTCHVRRRISRLRVIASSDESVEHRHRHLHDCSSSLAWKSPQTHLCSLITQSTFDKERKTCKLYESLQ